MSSMVTRPEFPYLFAVLKLWFAEGQCGGDGARPRSSHHGRSGAPHISSAPTQGHPSPGRSAPPCFAAESVRADTLRAYPENAAAPAQRPSAERRYRPKVTSGCPKRSEGGFPVGTRTNTAFRAESMRSQAGAEPSGPPPARTYPSRPAHPEEHAGRRHRSSPRPARVRRLHAHRWRLRG